MKRSAIFILALAVLSWTACGGSGGTSTKPVSKLKERAFVTNFQFGDVNIVDASKDELVAFTAPAGSGPTFMVESPDGSMTLVYNSTSNSITPVVNSTEDVPSTATSTVALGGTSESVVVAKDNKTGYAAVRNYFNGTGLANGIIQVFNYQTSTLSSGIVVANVRWLAINHAGTKLLAFNDLSDSATLVDVTTPATPVLTPVPGFSRPITAFFSSDDSKAYVLSCGSECGGSQAAVTELNMSDLTLGRSVNVSAARIGLMSGTTLYVAGSPNGSGGSAQTVDLSALTAGAPATVGPGTKYVINQALGKIWIGSTGCGSSGCLSLWDPAGTSVTIDNPIQKGDVTGMAFIAPRNVMYVCEGGEIKVYDANFTNLAPNLDVVGDARDVKYVPQ